jgi:YesN/AraC family two-component response regulator
MMADTADVIGSPRVIVADDNPVVRSGLTALLEAGGVRVIAEASDGQRAIELATNLRPDLVLLDVRMPLVDGVAAAKALSCSARCAGRSAGTTPCRPPPSAL